MTPLITVQELSASLNEVVLLDVRFGGPGTGEGRDAYLAGHIPGATFVDLETAFAASEGPGGRHPLPDTAAFQEAMRVAGVGAETLVVLYDDWKSIAAARGWWLLRHHGHHDVRVLDGGWGAWLAAGLPAEKGTHQGTRGDFTATAGDLRAIDADDAAALALDGVLLDARPADRFRGEGETIDPKAGHIPGAKSFPALSLVADDGRLLPSAELRARFEELEASGERVGVYCGSGIQAALATLAAEVAGLPVPALYAGSWSNWITDPSRPVETGA